MTDPATPPPEVDILEEIKGLLRCREGGNASAFVGVGLGHYLDLLHVAKAAAEAGQYKGRLDGMTFPLLMERLNTALLKLVT